MGTLHPVMKAARSLASDCMEDLRELVGALSFIVDLVKVLLISAFEVAAIVVESLEGGDFSLAAAAVAKSTSSIASRQAPLQDRQTKEEGEEELQREPQEQQQQQHEPQRSQQDEHDTPEDHPRLPRVDDLAYKTINDAFKLKIWMASDKIPTIFASAEERRSVCKLLSALHAFESRLCFRKWLLPYFRMLFERFGADETRVFAYLIAHPHLYAGVLAKNDDELCCWTPGCVGCNRPRHKLDDHAKDIRRAFIFYNLEQQDASRAISHGARMLRSLAKPPRNSDPVSPAQLRALNSGGLDVRCIALYRSLPRTYLKLLAGGSGGLVDSRLAVSRLSETEYANLGAAVQVMTKTATAGVNILLELRTVHFYWSLRDCQCRE